MNNPERKKKKTEKGYIWKICNSCLYERDQPILPAHSAAPALQAVKMVFQKTKTIDPSDLPVHS